MASKQQEIVIIRNFGQETRISFRFRDERLLASTYDLPATPLSPTPTLMSKNPNASSTKGGIKSRGMLPKHVWKRFLPLRRRPSIPQSPLPSPVGSRSYPASRSALTSHGVITPVPEILPPKDSSDDQPKPRFPPPKDSPFYLHTGYATFAKRASRPFPPPFVSKPSSSFSDPLTTHSSIRDRRPHVDGEFILGATNGDDAVFVTENYLVVNDGVGAWASKSKGHAALWSRLIGHFWGLEADRWMGAGPAVGEHEDESSAGSGGREVSEPPVEVEVKVESAQKVHKDNEAEVEMVEHKPEEERSRTEPIEDQSDGGASILRTEEEGSMTSTETGTTPTVSSNPRDSVANTDEQKEPNTQSSPKEPDPTTFLQKAFEKTQTITKEANDILGTTTFVSALLHHRPSTSETAAAPLEPLLYVTNLGDSTVLVVRPKHQEVIYRSKEQWHWFDCPRQLGTNSPDVPNANAVTDKVEVTEGDLVVAVSDGVADNLWEHEVCEILCDSLRSWEEHQRAKKDGTTSTETLTHRGATQKSGMSDHPVVEMAGDDQEGLVFLARELVRCARVIAEDNSAESPFMERAVDEGLPYEGGKMDDITVAIGRVTTRTNKG